MFTKNNKVTRILCVLVLAVTLVACFTGCDYEVDGSTQDIYNTLNAADSLQKNQPTPTDLDYSLERYNLTRRAYWVNGQREKANNLPCPVAKPLGYIVLFSGNTVVARFEVDGKVSSLNSFLTPDSKYYSTSSGTIDWLADVDGSYGENDSGIFFFTPDKRYIEWTGSYLYSDIPFIVTDPVVQIGGTTNE